MTPYKHMMYAGSSPARRASLVGQPKEKEMKTAFSRFNALMHAISTIMLSQSISRDLALAKAGGYQSRGKGQGSPSKRYRSGKAWPNECGAKQTARYLRQGLHNATVNGFQVIQRA